MVQSVCIPQCLWFSVSHSIYGPQYLYSTVSMVHSVCVLLCLWSRVSVSRSVSGSECVSHRVCGSQCLCPTVSMVQSVCIPQCLWFRVCVPQYGPQYLCTTVPMVHSVCVLLCLWSRWYPAVSLVQSVRPTCPWSTVSVPHSVCGSESLSHSVYI